MMVSFYAVRKLIESRKLSEKLISRRFEVSKFAPTGRAVHLFNWHDIERQYELDRPQKTQIDLPFLCNQFVHSYVFLPSINKMRHLDSVFFTSDRKRTSCLYSVDVSTIIELFEQTGRDYPAGLTAGWDAKRSDYIVKNR